jgi:hypothetical protein
MTVELTDFWRWRLLSEKPMKYYQITIIKYFFKSNMNKKYIPSGSSIQIETLGMVESLPDKARKTLKI